MSTQGTEAAGPLERTWGAVAGLPGATLGRTRAELAGIWREANELARGGNHSEVVAPVEAVDGQGPSADQVYLAWYAGLALMGALRLIEWRLAAVIATAHTVERYGHRRRFQEFVEGLDAGL